MREECWVCSHFNYRKRINSKIKKMKKITAIGIFLLFGICISCSQNDGLTQQEEAQKLGTLLSEIERLAASKICEDASEWRYTSYGEKACGGPVGFIAYATTIDTEDFLEKIAAHRAAEQILSTLISIKS